MLALFVSSVYYSLNQLIESLWVPDLLFFITMIPIIWWVSRIYFGKGVSSMYESALVGLIFITTNFVLDLLITVPVFFGSYMLYISDWSLWIYYLELLTITTATGVIGHRKV